MALVIFIAGLQIQPVYAECINDTSDIQWCGICVMVKG